MIHYHILNGFNRDIVECKGINSSFLCYVNNDLIETLWNVKLKDIPDGKEFTYDLIETLWNVKPEGSLFIICKSGFNRDIVECKVSSS